MTFYAPRNINSTDQLLFDAAGNCVGIQPGGSSSPATFGQTAQEKAANAALVSGARILRESSRRGFPLLSNITASSGHTLTWQSGTVGGVEYIERDGMRGVRLTTAAGLYVELNVPAFSRVIPKGQVAALYYIPDTPGNAVLTTVSMYVGSSGYSAAYSKPVTHSGSNVHANAHTGYFTLAPDPKTATADTVRVEWTVNTGTPDWTTTTMQAAKMRITPAGGQVAVVEIFGIWADGFASVPKCVFVADDGYDSIYDYGLPVFDRFGHRLSMAIIADSVGLSGYMTTAKLQEAEARGHECVVHGPNIAALNLSELTTQAEIEADLAIGQEQLRAAGLGQANHGDLIYVYPQGIYQHARDDHRIRDALIARGFIAARLATVTQSSLEMSHAGRLLLHLPIIGHTWVDDPSEAANIARIIVKIQEAAAQGRSVIIMLHKITSGAAAQALEMRQSNLTLICSALADLELAGTMQNATLGQLVQEMRANVGAV